MYFLHFDFKTFQNVLRATTACTFSRSELPKVVRTPSVFNILTSKCASRHNRVHFFDISTAKSCPHLVCFVHFDFEMCFAPQRRAVHFFDIATSKSGPALRCFAHLFLEMCFAPQRRAIFHLDPPEPQIIGKTQLFRDFPTFSRICIFFLLTLLSSNLSLLSASSLLCFSSVHIVGSLTSKLPSINYYCIPSNYTRLAVYDQY